MDPEILGKERNGRPALREMSVWRKLTLGHMALGIVSVRKTEQSWGIWKELVTVRSSSVSDGPAPAWPSGAGRRCCLRLQDPVGNFHVVFVIWAGLLLWGLPFPCPYPTASAAQCYLGTRRYLNFAQVHPRKIPLVTTRWRSRPLSF